MIMSSEEIVNEISNVASEINRFINENVSGKPDELYLSSLHYIKSGGKRLRPFMAVKSSELFNGTLESALPAACAVELIHNFTLVHDDIMDNADIRRGEPTVHKLYGINTGILTGDIMLAYAYRYLTQVPDEMIPALVKVFNKTAIEIFEGSKWIWILKSARR